MVQLVQLVDTCKEPFLHFHLDYDQKVRMCLRGWGGGASGTCTKGGRPVQLVDRGKEHFLCFHMNYDQKVRMLSLRNVPAWGGSGRVAARNCCRYTSNETSCIPTTTSWWKGGGGYEGVC